ncbi:hypothetical protein [uncultured Roseobacter sp.]|uniref:hypothetical protein n=1 Tax=uncultured Roseobacter sp. TaxID=114847 RepID=UPI00262C5593|nr:hypothetical protein [uncultured Roseobacter sp.]
MSDNLYIVNRERGFGPEALPIWTDKPGTINPFEERGENAVTRVELPEVPGAFQLLNVLSDTEADNIVKLAEQLGFHQDSPVSLPHSVRHNQNANWVVSEEIDRVFWERSKHLLTEEVNGQKATGINARFRFYRHDEGDYFKPHSDGAWPGSRVVNGKLADDVYPGQLSQDTYLNFLNDGYEGGRTQFMVSKSNPSEPAKREDDVNLVEVRTTKGDVLVFPHGHHPLHCLHSSEQITSGEKYIIRSDVLFG